MNTDSVGVWRHQPSVVNGVYLAATFLSALCLIAFACLCRALWVRENALVAITGFLFVVSAVTFFLGFLRNGLLRSLGAIFVSEGGQVTTVRHRGRDLIVDSQENRGGVLKLSTSAGRFCFIGKR